MHKIDLSTNNFRMRRFVVLQLVIALFVILFTYKWALGVTAVVDQNIIINIIYGFGGFIVLLILHELIHRVLFLVFKKDSKPMFNIKKDRMLFQTADACFNKWQFSIIMLSPLLSLSSVLLILIKSFGYSSLIFMLSIHTAYCLIDILLVALTITSNFKYVQQDKDSIYLYHQKPIQ
ncbi:metalloprotease family protein [Staphylococcus schweitzeri]|uniref:metalloprotease family protein n=1 Tax=Staphylococcus schweitzeri TaxID=1654388 RepID=UPI000504FA97|nr:metalloprotease family protein [Staphylococcus schweitzeri]CDR26460.1 Permease [Staphylococcus schweitzeri]